MTVRRRSRAWVPAVAGTVLAANGSTVGAATWSQVIASTTSGIYVTAIVGGHMGSTATYDVGVGGAGAETVATSFAQRSVTGAQVSATVPLPVPCRIPAGTRVSVRHSVAVSAIDGITYEPESLVRRRPYFLPGTGSTGSSTPVYTSGTSWVEMVSSTSAALYLTYAFIDNVGGAGTYDIGIGGVGAEVAVVSLGASASVVAGATHVLSPIVRIPAGTRLSCRGPGSNSTVFVGYVYESAVVW